MKKKMYKNMKNKFIKMHGLGNDFAIFDERQGDNRLGTGQIRQLSDRRLGIGCDQLIVMEPSQKAAVFMRIYNSDGSQSEACGNATRCVGRLIMDETHADSTTIETLAGVLTVTRQGPADITVDMGRIKTRWQDIPLAEDVDTLRLPISLAGLSEPTAINIGNPHAVFFVEDVAAVDIARIGPQIENHPLFPSRTNVEFAQVISSAHLRMRVWERGVGITKACGSGACAVAAAAICRGPADRRVTVTLDGGDLEIYWREDDEHILMTGPAVESFRGEVEI